MKELMLFVVLCTVVAMAAGLAVNGDKNHLRSLLLRSDGNTTALKEKEKLANEKIVKCFEGAKIREGNAGVTIECLNNHKDNTECCKKAGFADDKCAKMFCDGKPPVHITDSESTKCEDSFKKMKMEVVYGATQCYYDSYN